MVATIPGRAAYLIEIQDITGQRARLQFNVEDTPDYQVAPDTFFQQTLGTAMQNVYSKGAVADVVTAVAALTNAKVVRAGLLITADWASEPTSESGKNIYVQTKASLNFIDGFGGKNRVLIPAPVDGLFLAGVGMQNVVNPALSLAGGGGIIGALQTALVRGTPLTANGGSYGAQFEGGQLIQGKAPRRRRIQGQ